MAKPVRRVVTGLSSKGEATVLIDSPSPHVMEIPAGGGVTEIWATKESPATYDNSGDRAIFPMQHDPDRGGTICRYLEMPAGVAVPDVPPEEMLEAARAQFAGMQSDFVPSPESVARHPSFHKTDSVDYLVILSGRLTMLMDGEEEVTLEAGDVIVQQGVMHGWRVEGDESVHMFAVLVDGVSAYD